jgi:hypothetical protein
MASRDYIDYWTQHKEESKKTKISQRLLEVTEGGPLMDADMNVVGCDVIRILVKNVFAAKWLKSAR